MPTGTDSVVQRIQSLLAEKLHHSTAIARIDEMLGRIGAVLRPGTGGKSQKMMAKASKPGRGKRKTFAMSGEEAILVFVKKAGHPTSQEIQKHWKGQGRGGAAANALGKLVRLKKLKREAIKGGRGSRYSIG